MRKKRKMLLKSQEIHVFPYRSIRTDRWLGRRTDSQRDRRIAKQTDSGRDGVTALLKMVYNFYSELLETTVNKNAGIFAEYTKILEML